MSKLYKLYLRTLFVFSTDFPPKGTLSELVTHSMARIDRGKTSLHLPTRAEFYTELKRLTAAPPKPEPKVAPITLIAMHGSTISDKITLIKALREVAADGGFNSGLRECKETVDRLTVGVSFTFKVKTAERRAYCIDTLRAAGAVIA